MCLRKLAAIVAVGSFGVGLVATARETVPPAGTSGRTSWRFDFGNGLGADGYTRVASDDLYSAETGFGFEPGFTVRSIARDWNDPLRSDACTGDRGFYFSAAVPEGNYRVTVTLGDETSASETTVKAELRRLMLENVTTAPGEFTTRSFIVNVRVPEIAGGGRVRLKAPRETTQEAWAWDDRLTLEFDGPASRVCAVTIEAADVPTVFILGDSTVCDQSREPYTSWGQMLTRFFRPDIAIANHGESGETYRDSIGRRRLDKVVSLMRRGDFLILQFGHNDQKQLKAGTGTPFTTFKDEIRQHISAAEVKGCTPILVTPMHRLTFEGDKVVNSLGDYPEAVRQVAREQHVALIDLNAMSKDLYEALGPEGAKVLFAAPEGRLDTTHHNAYGSYELARCVVHGIRLVSADLSKHLLEDVNDFDPRRPDAPGSVSIPPSPLVTTQTPLGQ